MYRSRRVSFCLNGAAGIKTKRMDDIDITILQALQENARIPIAELGRKAGLSGKAVAERVKRLEEDGVISGYRAVLNPAKIGFPVRANKNKTTPHKLFPK